MSDYSKILTIILQTSSSVTYLEAEQVAEELVQAGFVKGSNE